MSTFGGRSKNTSDVFCVYFRRGCCRYGEECRYRHEMPESAEQRRSANRLKLTNLPPYFTDEDLLSMLRSFGFTILNCSVLHTLKNGAIGFISFSDPNDAYAALMELDGYFADDTNEYPLSVEYAWDPPDHYVCKQCHVGGHWIQECPLNSMPPPPKKHHRTQCAKPMHLKGNKYRQSPDNNEFHCDLCNVTVFSEAYFQNHIKGQKHQNALNNSGNNDFDEDESNTLMDWSEDRNTKKKQSSGYSNETCLIENHLSESSREVMRSTSLDPMPSPPKMNARSQRGQSMHRVDESDAWIPSLFDDDVRDQEDFERHSNGNTHRQSIGDKTSQSSAFPNGASSRDNPSSENPQEATRPTSLDHDDMQTVEKQAVEKAPVISPATFCLSLMDSKPSSQRLISQWKQLLSPYGVHFDDSSKLIGAEYHFDPTTKCIQYRYQCPYPPNSIIEKSEPFHNGADEDSATMMATVKMMVFIFDELFGLNFQDIQFKLVLVAQNRYHSQVMHGREEFIHLKFPPNRINVENGHFSLQKIYEKMSTLVDRICRVIDRYFVVGKHKTFNAVSIKQEMREGDQCQIMERKRMVNSGIDRVASDVEEIRDGSNKRRFDEDECARNGFMPPRKRMRTDENRNVSSEFMSSRSESGAVDGENLLNGERFEEWNAAQIIKWIGEIEKGRFAKYVSKLSPVFQEEEICGSDMSLITEQNWREWGIVKFRDRKDLHLAVQYLTQ